MWTDLPQNIQRHIRIVPYVPVHDDIIKYAYCEFHSSYYHCADKTAAYKCHSTVTVYAIKDGKNCSACQGHCPVGVSPVKYFDKAVQKIAHQKGKCIL